jgi:phosphoglycerol transferase MdoB-like AlkP superfamily enzyme
MYGGLQFDLAALIYANIIYMLLMLLPFRLRKNTVYQSVAKYVFLFFNILMIIVNCADMPFFRFTNRRTTSTIFSEFQHENNLLQIIGSSLVTYWYVTLFAAVIIFLLCFLFRKPKVPKSKLSPFIYYPLHTAILLFFGYSAIIGIRGGFGAFTRPITLSNANKFVDKSNETAVVLNTPFCMLRTINKKVYKNPQYFKDTEEMETIFSPIHQPKPEGEFKPLNVVVLIFESFGKEYSGFFNKNLDNGTYKGYTPFLDSLYQQGYTFRYSYATGRKSIDAMPSVLSSIPMFIEPYILTPYSTNDISSIASVLKEKGYYSAFFHGAPNGSMGFEAYAKVAGFEDYFGLNEYNAVNKGNDDYDGVWAIWDEKFLQYYAQKMGEIRQPFVTSLFTASSHDPFQVPKEYEGKFPEGTKPIHKTIGYSDNALRQFFKTMSKYDWYDNTLFVITADHTNQIAHDEYFTDANLYSVPILFYQPNSSLKSLDTTNLAQQADIMPSILTYLNYEKPYFAYGQNAINTQDSDKYVVNFNNQIYQLYQHDYFLQFDGEKVKSVYNFKTDTLLQQNLVGKIKEQKEMETLLKAIIQQYIVRMTENRLTIEKNELSKEQK